MSRIIIFFLLFVYSQIANGKNTSIKSEYSSDLIKPELLKNAAGVVRNKITRVEIKNNHELVIRDTLVITIFNEHGLDPSLFSVSYDSFSNISDVTAIIYDEKGRLINVINKEQVHDVAYTGYSIFSDTRVKFIQISRINYPFTVEFTYKQKIDGFLNPEPWTIANKPMFSIEQATLIIRSDESNGNLIHKEINLERPEVIKESGINQFTWTVNKIEANPEENLIPINHCIYPKLLYALESFEIDNHVGSFSSWKEFGKFYYELNSKSSVLNNKATEEINQIIQNIVGEREKIKKLYLWMQSQTRYASIQKGIGGWKSFDANSVYDNKIGDCKALVNYMMSVLKVAGITAYPTLISAGVENYNFVYRDFPYNYFNHVILTIPLQSDTVWLECTDQNIPFNFLGNFTADRDGLIIADNDSKIIHTPNFNSSVNRSYTKTTININKDERSSCNISASLYGELSEECSYFFYKGSTEQKKIWLRRQLSLSDYNIDTYEILNDNSDSIKSGYIIDLKSNSISSFSESRIFIHPFVLNGFTEIFPITKQRKFPLRLRPEAIFEDSIEIIIPVGYIPETTEKSEIIFDTIGNYEYTYKYIALKNIFYIKSKFKCNDITLAPENYNTSLDFISKVINRRKKTIVLIHQ